MVAYLVDPARSSVSAVLRPSIEAAGPLAATIRGEVQIDDRSASAVHGTVWVALAHATGVALDVPSTHPELDHGTEGELVLRGSATRPAGLFGLTGPPLLNPTVVLRWRATLVRTD